MSRLFRPTRQTKEEKAAVEIGDILSDFRLDLDSLGYYVARSNPYVIYRRFEAVADAAIAERDGIDNTRMENYNDRLL